MRNFFCILFVFYFLNIFGQKYHFKTFTTEDGLSNNSVADIANDTTGALWIATWDGLNHFDSNKFTVYKHVANDSTSIAGNEIHQLLNDKNNNLWIRTDKSISKYLGSGKFKNYSFTKEIRKLHKSKKNNPIILLDDNSYLEFTNGQFTKSSKEQLKADEKSIYKNLLLSKKPNLFINDAYKDDVDNNILVASRYNGLFIIRTENDTFKIINYKKDLYNSHSINSNEVEKIHKDIFGGIWLGLKDGGLSLVQKTADGVTTIVPHPDEFPHLPNETIRAISKDEQQLLWLGYYTKGLYRFSNKTNCFLPFHLSKAKEETDWNRIRSLYKTSDGALWVGTYAGIIRIKKQKQTYFSAQDYPLFPNNRTYSFCEKKGKLWIACWGGVAKINLKTLEFESFKGQEKLTNFHVRNLHFNKENLLIATQNYGLLSLNISKGNLTTITEKEGLSGNSVFSILKDKKTHTIWVATLGGISVLDENLKVLKTIRETDGLPSHMVYSLLENDNKIWASTTKGIVKINKENFTVKVVNPNENWQSKEFSEGAYYKDNENVLYFGGVKGLSFFKPENLKVSASLPKLVVKVQGANGFSVIKKSSDNFLKIQITPISYTKNANNKVLYRLEGYDTTWRLLNKNAILYEKLSAGNYTFKVKNSLDFSEKNVITYKINIKKPFYLSNSFLGSCLALGILVFFYFLYQKNKRFKEYQKKLELEIEKRTSTIESQKNELLHLHNSIKNNEFEIDKFQTFVVDKFKQPLTFILENVSSLSINHDKKQSILSEVNTLMNKVIEWNYLEDIDGLGEFKKVLVGTDTLQEIFLQYHQNFKESNYEVTVKGSNDLIELDLVRYKLLAQYLLNDIIKFTKTETNFCVEISTEKQLLFVTIKTDNHLLIDNLEYIKKYSPYYKAFASILKDLDGQITTSKKENLTINITIPINIGDNEGEEHINSVSLSNIELPIDKTVFLVHTNDENYEMASCILESSENHLVFESDVNKVHKLLHKTKRFSILVLYNVAFSNKLVDILTSIHKNNILPTIYISEKIDFSLQEKITTFHINDVIQLPASKKLITQKIDNITNGFTAQTVKEKETVTSPNEKLVNKAVKIIKDSYGNADFNVDYLADELSISRIKCYRMFKEVLKQSPSDVIIQQRMQIAEELLTSTNLNISEISTECGFNDPKYFSKVFKKYFGVNPKKFKTN